MADLNNLVLQIDNNTSNSLQEFSKELVSMMQVQKPVVPAEVPQTLTSSESPEEPIKVGIDFLKIGAIDLGIKSKSGTWIDWVSILPDLNIKLKVNLGTNLGNSSRASVSCVLVQIRPISVRRDKSSPALVGVPLEARVFAANLGHAIGLR